MKEELTAYINLINQWRRRKVSKNKFLIIAAAVVGILGGIAASLLKELTHTIANFLENRFHWEYKYYLYFFFPLIGIFLTVLYIRTFIRKGKFQHGISAILLNISHNSSKIDFHNIYSQIFSSAITVGFGGSAGLEAPIVASGSAIGSNFGRFFGLSYRETTLLLACGAAAGIAGAFNSPVAGMVFAIEVLLPEFSIPALVPLLLSAALSSVVSRFVYSEPLFVFLTEGWEVRAIWFYIFLGIVSGLFSVYYSKINDAIHRRFEKIKNQFSRVWTGGIILGVLIALFPALYGEGYITIQKLLNGNHESLLANSFFSEYRHYPWVLLLFALLTLFGKSVASVVTMSSGGNGGMFGPTVVVGGLVGFVFAYGANLTGLVHLNITNFMVAGMAASVSGMMHAPLTGIFLSAEITGGYALMVPLMIVSAISFFINRGFLKYSIYTGSIAASGKIIAQQSKEHSILRLMKLRYLIEKDFAVLRPEDSVLSRKEDVIHSRRNIFPVVNNLGVLAGVVYTESLLEVLVRKQNADPPVIIKELAEQPQQTVRIQTSVLEVLRLMDQEDLRMIPVTDADGRYLGFVTKNGILNKYRRILIRQDNQ